MNLFGREVSGFAKVLVILVAVFLVASGMCGMQLILANTSMKGGSGDLFLPLGVVELIAMLVHGAEPAGFSRADLLGAGGGQ